VLVREELRLILVGAFVCLLASSLHVPITIKNFLIISTAFVGLGFGMLHSLRPFSEDWDAKSRLLVGAVGLLFLALAFPYIPKWNPRELFDKSQGHE
jgi:peptidoglycan/LPS O-acetylase OafA/YrhL